MPAQRITHPSAEVLKAFGLGKLEDSLSGMVLDHLDSCPDCRKVVASLSGDDFLDRLRQAHSSTTLPAARSLPAPGPPKPPAGPKLVNLPPELADSPQYEVLRELGKGGMGVVYLARNKLMDRPEVLKVINKALLDQPGAIDRFLREIRSAARLGHPNVVAAYSALQLGELLVFAMEYVEGQDLAAVVKAQGPLPVVHACFYVQQAALGLQHAFEKGMVHRDIKPQNLILAREGRKHLVKVLDFGLAKATREKQEDLSLTGEGRMLGTPDYMAPEQALDAARADIRADVYSLGCTLYFLLSGRPPFRAQSLGAVVLAHQMDEAAPLNEVRPEAPAELAAVVRRMMAKSADQRYQTPREVVQALSPFVKQGAVSRSSPGLLPQETDARSPATKTAEGRIVRAAGRTGPGQKWLIGVGLSGAVLLLALLGLWAGGVFKVKTKDGTLVLKNLPPDAEVTVDDGKVTLQTAEGNSFAVSIAPGKKRRLQVKKEGVTIFGEDVEIEAGARRTITVGLEPLPAAAADSDRQVAEWVLTQKGTVQVRGEGEQKEKEVAPGEKLPEEHFELVEVKLISRPVGDAGLARLKGLTHLARLIVWDRHITDAGLAHLEDLTTLRRLDLNGSAVTDAGMVHLERLTRLSTLNLMGTPTTGSGFGHLEALTSLEVLYLASSGVGDEGLAHLGRLNKLTLLGLDSTRVSDAGLVHLKSLKDLRDLYLLQTKVTQAGISGLQKALPDCCIHADPPAEPALPAAETLRRGSVWRGTRTYRKGAWAGATVTYEIHVVERDGPKFKAFKFDNGPGRNRADFVGEIRGSTLTWHESRLSFKGTLSANTIQVKFSGPVGNGWTTEGDGELKLTK